MTSIEMSGLLTQTGPGTPLGELLRRYWQPFFVASELTDARPIRPTRILSETLVLFRDKGGRMGLIQERCPHGGYQLIFGSIDGNSLACARHGWHFDIDGNCWVVGYQDKIYPMGWAHGKTYPVRQYAGLLWTYLGPEPAPDLPRLDVLARDDGRRRITVYPNTAANVFEDPGFDADSLLLPTHRRHGALWLRMPMDDSHTWQVAVEFARATDGAAADPFTEAPEIMRADALPPTGTEADKSEARIARLQELFLAEIDRVSAGADPTGVTRDAGHPMIETGLI